MPSVSTSADRGVQRALVGRLERRRAPQRMELRAPQRLVGVDVADAREERLVHEQRLEAAAPAADELPERWQRECGVQRLGTQLVERVGLVRAQGLAGLVAPVQRHPRELAHVAHQQLAVAVEREHEVDVPVARRCPAGSTNTWPVILTWSAMTQPPDSSSTSHLARRLTSSMRLPATPAANASGSGCLMAFGQSVQKPSMVEPRTSGRSSRAMVSTSGSSGIGPSLPARIART